MLTHCRGSLACCATRRAMLCPAGQLSVLSAWGGALFLGSPGGFHAHDFRDLDTPIRLLCGCQLPCDAVRAAVPLQARASAVNQCLVGYFRVPTTAEQPLEIVINPHGLEARTEVGLGLWQGRSRARPWAGCMCGAAPMGRPPVGAARHDATACCRIG